MSGTIMYEDVKAVIKVFSAGREGARTVGRMAGRVQGVDFFRTVEDVAEMSGQIAVGGDLSPVPAAVVDPGDALRAAMGDTHLVFIVSSFEGEPVAVSARSLADAARQIDCFTMGVTSAPAGLVLNDGSFDTLIRIRRDCIVPHNDAIPITFGRTSLLDYLMRHAVQQVTALIVEQSIICVDFADVKAVFAGGGDSFMGIGVAGGPGRGTTAAVNALEGLARQQVDVTGVDGVVACITGSTNMTLDDFDAASRVIHEAVPEEANLICGLLVDDALGENLKVTLFANFAAWAK